MRKVSRFLLILCLGLTVSMTFAQTESTLYFMNSLPQVMDLNPSIMPRYKLSIGLPGISSVGAVYTNNGFTYNDMTSRDANGKIQADLTKLTGTLAPKNYVMAAGSVDLLRIGLRASPKMYFMFNATAKGYSRSMVDKGLIALIADGTAPLVNSFSNNSPQQESLSYLETGLTMAYQVNDRLTVGGRLKYLNGIANVTTDHSSVNIQVSNTYSINVVADATAHSSGIQNYSNSGYNAFDHFGDYMGNNGAGIDLGVTYKFMEKLTFGFSIIDLGFINWKNNTYQYRLDPAIANYTFSGFDLNKALDRNTDYLNAEWEAAKDKFKLQETPSASYSTNLPTKFYLNGTYALNNGLSIGALFFSESFRDRYSAGMTASANKTFGKVLTTSLSYTVSNRSYNNIGLGLSVNVSPVQLYIVGDNLLRAPVSLVTDQSLNAYINSSQVITVRAGLNLVFGWDKGLVRKETTNDETHNPKEKNTNGSKVKNTFGRSPEKSKKKKSKNSPAKAKPPKSKIGR